MPSKKLPAFVIALLVAVVAWAAFLTPDVQADSHGYGCHGVAADYGCSEPAAGNCGVRGARAEGRWFPGRAIVRGTGAVLRGTARAASAPLKAVGRARFRPSRRFGGCG